jgi:intraflagellar transport protein 80
LTLSRQIDKVQYVLRIKSLPTEESRAAELLLFQRRPKQAEAVLLQAQLIYRAIKLNVKLFNWERALELALKYKTHLDTVLAYRRRYLSAAGGTETLKRFQPYSSEVRGGGGGGGGGGGADSRIVARVQKAEWATVKERIKHDKEAEQQRPTARPYAE